MGSPQWRKNRNVPQGKKVEPIPHAVDVRSVGQIGTSLGNHAMEVGRPLPRGGISYELYKGHGFKGPEPVGVHVHKCGSQGES